MVSEINNCLYCLSAHPIIAKSAGISAEMAMEIRSGHVSSDEKLDRVVKLAKAITENRGSIDESLLTLFFGVGYTSGNLVDLNIVTIVFHGNK